MADEEIDLGEKGNIKTIFSQGLLATSGGYGLSRTIAHFAGPAFGISLLSGFIGVLTNLTGHEALETIYKYTGPLSRTFVLPLVATEVCCANGIQLELSALNLLYPTVHYLCRYLINQEESVKPVYLEISHAFSICAIAYFSFLQENWYGVGMAIAYALSCFGREVVDDTQCLVIFMACGNFLYFMK